MPTREDQYLIRRPDGTCVTVTARSLVGAIRRYVVKNPRTPRGSELDVKLRTSDEAWVTYKVDR